MLLFIDESGQEGSGGPYQVLAGAVIRQANLWNLVKSVRAAERVFFGDYLRNLLDRETKAKELLKRKRFRSADRTVNIREDELTPLANAALTKGKQARQTGKSTSGATQRELVAYSRQVLQFVHEVLDIAARHGVRFIAAIIDTSAPESDRDHWLGKDMLHLMRRYYEILRQQHETHHGLIVCDELEKSKAKHLVQRMARYFLGSPSGSAYSSLIVPEPFFVHSELTTGVLLADMAAYLLSWGWRLPDMTEPHRDELSSYVKKLEAMKSDGRPKSDEDEGFIEHGFRYLKDMRHSAELGDNRESRQ